MNCQYCNKHFEKKRGLTMHERHCTMNPTAKPHPRMKTDTSFKPVPLDPKLQRGLWDRYKAPQVKCPKCGGDSKQVYTKPYHDLHTIERFLRCTTEATHCWVEMRKMGS